MSSMSQAIYINLKRYTLFKGTDQAVKLKWKARENYYHKIQDRSYLWEGK